MISEKQLAANRRNAEKSTGPRTDEGKRRTSLNALRHGITGQISVLSDDERQAHDQFFAAYLAELKPIGIVEIDLAQSAAEDAWRLRRARAIEDNIFALGHPDLAEPDAMPDPHPQLATALATARTFVADPRKFQLITLYEQRLHRSMQKSLALLTQLQEKREAARLAAFEDAQMLAQRSNMKGIPYEPALDFPPENGLVFSTEEINYAVRRERRLREAKHFERWCWEPTALFDPTPVTLIDDVSRTHDLSRVGNNTDR